MYIGMFFLLLGIGFCFMNLFSILTPIGFILIINKVCVPVEEKMIIIILDRNTLNINKK